MEASGDMTRWLSRPKWRLWFRQIIAPPSNVQCGVKTPKWKWQTSTHLSSISTWRFEQFWILQKCEAAKPGEFWEAILPSYDRQQPSVRDRSPRLWNIRFCSVCSHQERSTWATWLTHGGLPPSPMWVSRFRHCPKRPIGGRWTPSILQPVLWNFVMACRQCFPFKEYCVWLKQNP